MNACFVIQSSKEFEPITNQAKRSIEKFYDLPIFVYPLVWSDPLPDSFYEKMIDLHKDFNRVIYWNADMIMCAPCPRLFLDFEYAMPLNNIETWNTHPFMNNGLQVTTTDKPWRDQLALKDREGSKEQRHSNEIFWDYGYKTLILDTDTESYGLRDYKDFENAELKGKDIYINNHKICVFHFATRWHFQNKLAFHRFKNKDVVERLLWLTS